MSLRFRFCTGVSSRHADRGSALHAGSHAQNGHAAAERAGAPDALPPPPPPPSASADDDDDDIFGGVGAEYELPEKRVGGAAAKPATYFDRKGEMIDLPALPSGTSSASGVQTAS